jgi:hypothetical protein
MTTINVVHSFTVTVGPIGGEDDYDTDVLMEIAVEDGEAFLVCAFTHNERVEEHTSLWIECEEWVDDNQGYLIDQAGFDNWCANGDAINAERRA